MSPSRQRRRRELRKGPASEARPPRRRPWYYRYGYHLGVWAGAVFGVAYYAIFREITGLIIGIVLGQIAGLLLARRGRVAKA